MKTLRHALLLILVLVTTPGCTAVMFAVGEKGVDLARLQPGATRAEVEALLGTSLRQWDTPMGVRHALYQYDAGRPPSAKWAAASVALNLVSMGLLEILVALHSSPEPHVMGRLVVSYDSADVVLGVHDEFEALPADGRSPPRRVRR